MTERCTCGFKGVPEHKDLYDCVEYYEEKSGKIKGQWMIDWAKKSKEAKIKNKSEGFKAWAKNAERKANENK